MYIIISHIWSFNRSHMGLLADYIYRGAEREPKKDGGFWWRALCHRTGPVTDISDE